MGARVGRDGGEGREAILSDGNSARQILELCVGRV